MEQSRKLRQAVNAHRRQNEAMPFTKRHHAFISYAFCFYLNADFAPQLRPSTVEYYGIPLDQETIMKQPINIGLDFHGTTFDHRLSKYLFFKLQVGVPYSDPYIDRTKIVEELEALGYSRDWYFETLREFFDSEWSLSGEITSGLSEFLAAAPPHWRFIVLSGMSSNILSIRRIVAYSDLTRIAGVYRVPDERKPEVCERLNVKLYFDDKPDTLPDFTTKAIKCVQISTEGYSEVSKHASFHCENWHQVTDSLAQLRALVQGPAAA